jgi:hypothetical protein
MKIYCVENMPNSCRPELGYVIHAIFVPGSFHTMMAVIANVPIMLNSCRDMHFMPFSRLKTHTDNA